MKKVAIFALLLLSLVVAWQAVEIDQLKHQLTDRDIYIDAGCHGRYQGD